MERRRLVLAGAAAVAAVAVSVTPSAAVTPVGSKPVAVSLLSTGQQKILSSKAVAVRVFVRRPGRYKLKLSLVGADPGAGAVHRPIAKRRVVRFKRAGSRIFSLQLTPAGSAAVADCRSQNLSLLAKRKRSKNVRAANVSALDRDSAACKQLGSAGAGGGSPGSSDEPLGGTSPGPSISNGDRCDWIDPNSCLYPWPNDFYTTADPSTPTGRRLDLKSASMPTNNLTVPIDPAPYNVADGFSPGNMIITKIPGFDNQQAFDNTGAVPIDDMGAYADPNQPVVVIDATPGPTQGQRWPIWSEIDANPPNQGDRTLIIRPAKNFLEGHRYIVALRDLKDDAGDPIQPSLGFRVYRDRLITPQTQIENRRPHMEDIFHTLQAAGIKRLNLNLAWDFTVASRDTLSGRARAMRDDAFHQLGDDNLSDLQVQGSSPVVNVSKVTNYTAVEDSKIARQVEGTVTVPCYLNAPGCPSGSTYNLDANGKPAQLFPGNSISANFICEIPRSALDGATHPKARPSLYGHGLLGSANEVGGGNVKSMAAEHNVMECATDWVGFATGDVPTVLLILQDLNGFSKLVDRTQQSFLDFMFLGRAMIHPNGFSSMPAFQDGDGTTPGTNSVIDTQRLYYDGNSQGGILGGALTALEPDLNRSVLGVPAINYSTLLERSTDFTPYAEGRFTSTICGLFPPPLNAICNLAPQDTPLGLYDNYPDQLTRPLLFSIMQLLWDRGEPDGYAQHMTTDPLPNTPPHEVLLHPAFGDHQVANVAAEVEARTIGASAYKPAQYPGRSPDVDPLFGIPAIPGFPFNGSAIVYYDGGAPPLAGGTTPPPTTDTPPVNGLPGNGADPHSYPRSDIKARAQKSAFLMPNGVVQNYCLAENNPLSDYMLLTLSGSPTPCYSHGFTGP